MRLKESQAGFWVFTFRGEKLFSHLSDEQLSCSQQQKQRFNTNLRKSQDYSRAVRMATAQRTKKKKDQSQNVILRAEAALRTAQKREDSPKRTFRWDPVEASL